MIFFIVDGEWLNWQKWFDCIEICGGGIRKCICKCDNFVFVNGGLKCLGFVEEEEVCNEKFCLSE